MNSKGQKWEALCVSRNGLVVSFDPVNSHAITHFKDTPGLRELAIKVISNLELHGEPVGAHFDMGRVIGTCDVVAVDSTDEIVYGMRKNRRRDGLVPFTKSRTAEPCRFVSLHLLPQDDGVYILSSAWIGTFGDDEPFPQSPEATSRSITYWRRHAFVHGSQEIISGTETKKQPW